MIAIILWGSCKSALSVELHGRVASPFGLPAGCQELDRSKMSATDIAGLYPKLRG